MIYVNDSGDNFEKWLEDNDDDLWAEYHETGAYYEGDYEDWLEWKYDKEILHESISI